MVNVLRHPPFRRLKLRRLNRTNSSGVPMYELVIFNADNGVEEGWVELSRFDIARLGDDVATIVREDFIAQLRASVVTR